MNILGLDSSPLRRMRSRFGDTERILPEETQGEEPAELDTIPIMPAKFLQDATMRDDPANHAGRYRLCADILGPELEQVNVMRCHLNEVPECLHSNFRFARRERYLEWARSLC